MASFISNDPLQVSGRYGSMTAQMLAPPRGQPETIVIVKSPVPPANPSTLAV